MTITSNDIENFQSVGVRNANDLCLKCVQPFIIHIISRILREEPEYIDNIKVDVEVVDLSNHDLVSYNLDK